MTGNTEDPRFLIEAVEGKVEFTCVEVDTGAVIFYSLPPIEAQLLAETLSAVAAEATQQR